MKKYFTPNFSPVVAATFGVLMIGTLAFGQTSFAGYVTEAVARNIYYLVTPTAAPSSETIESENKLAQTTAGNSISGDANERAFEILSPQADATPILWSSAGGPAWLTGTNWTGGAVPTGTETAQFGVNPTAVTGVGINFGSTTNAGRKLTDSESKKSARSKSLRHGRRR